MLETKNKTMKLDFKKSKWDMLVDNGNVIHATATSKLENGLVIDLSLIPNKDGELSFIISEPYEEDLTCQIYNPSDFKFTVGPTMPFNDFFEFITMMSSRYTQQGRCLRCLKKKWF